MRALQKLFRHGNTTGVVIPRVMLHHLGWLPGQYVIVEEIEDNQVRVRLGNTDDVDMLVRSGRIVAAPGPVRG